MAARVFIDQIGNSIFISGTPKRIVSLVPSQTELLFHLGLNQEVIGITKFCVHPNDWLQTKQIVGGTKNFWFDVIDSVKPDLIIGNKEENYEEGIKHLQLKYPVWVSDITTLDDALTMIQAIAEMTRKQQAGLSLVSKIRTSFDQLKLPNRRRVLYLIWHNPWMGTGRQTFIHAMLEKAGFTNALERSDRYPQLSAKDIQTLNPEVVLLSSEPFPFKEEHMAEIRVLLPNALIKLVDGEMFSWYGSRLIKAPAYFIELQASIH